MLSHLGFTIGSQQVLIIMENCYNDASSICIYISNDILSLGYLVLQITAVFIRLSDLILQLFAPFILTRQFFGQQLVPLSGFR